MENKNNEKVPYFENRTYITINKKYLIENIKNIKKHIKSQKICAVIKDNAYAHNAISFAKVIDKYIDFFGVSTIDEAISLKNVTKSNILILGHIENDKLILAIKNNIRLTVSYLEQAILINNLAKSINKKAIIHLGINTGMNRIGFELSDDSINDIVKINNLSNIVIEGIFSHYSVADIYYENTNYKNFTINQKELFDSFVKKLEDKNLKFEIKHIANSAGTLLSLFKNTDMVRPGIILYGLYPSTTIKKTIKIKPVLSLYSKIVYLKTISKNQTISYGNTFKSKKQMTIATVSIGYGDGYPRSINKNQKVIINGKYCKIVGRVTMDQLMVDVTNVKCDIGDIVIMIGEYENKKISFYDLSKNTGILHYELLCNLNHRVPIYYIN